MLFGRDRTLASGLGPRYQLVCVSYCWALAYAVAKRNNSVCDGSNVVQCGEPMPFRPNSNHPFFDSSALRSVARIPNNQQVRLHWRFSSWKRDGAGAHAQPKG